MKVILKSSTTNIFPIFGKGKKKKNDPILTKKKRISPTHKTDNQVVYVNLGKDDGAQMYVDIKMTPLVTLNAKGIRVLVDYLKKKSINLRAKEGEGAHNPFLYN